MAENLSSASTYLNDITDYTDINHPADAQVV